MSELKDIKTGTHTVVSSGAAAVNISIGFVPTTVELTNENTGTSKLYTIGVTAGVTALNASPAAKVVNYDSNNGGSEGGTVVTTTKAGFTIAASLAGYNDTTGQILRYVARK